MAPKPRRSSGFSSRGPDKTSQPANPSGQITEPSPSGRRKANFATRRRSQGSSKQTAVPVTKGDGVLPTTGHFSDDGIEAEAVLGDDEPMQDRDGEGIETGRTYFEAYKGALATTNLTLANLSLAAPDELSEALAEFEDPLRPEQEAQLQKFKEKNHKFEYFLNADHSLLFYGLGSKRAVLDNLATHLSSSGDVVVINGFNPTLSLRTAFTQLAVEVLGLKSFSKRSLLDYVDAISEAMQRKRGTTVSVVIHNIDGAALRPSEAQLALSRLAEIPRVRFAASIDHVNAPLLWDAPMFTSFSWMWIQCDTFGAYDAETFFLSKPLQRGGSERRVEGAVAFLNSLTGRARSVFHELAKRQMGADTGGSATRTTFNDLFEAMKKDLIITDTGTLRNVVNEIETHDLLQTRRAADAAQQLWIPLPDEQLKAILKEIGLYN